jgi:hypothetical protein
VEEKREVERLRREKMIEQRKKRFYSKMKTEKVQWQIGFVLRNAMWAGICGQCFFYLLKNGEKMASWTQVLCQK